MAINDDISGNEHIYTPAELNREVRLHIEMGFPRILLEAEISNLSRPASGHLYFTLKDQSAQVRCALFRSSAAKLSIRPENGMKVLARGRISLYEARGEFQMIVDGLREAGEGLLLKQFEELKKKLEAEGLFEKQHKKPLNPYPQRIGLITSSSGAAVRDVLHVLQRRWPLAQLRLYPVAVQGAEAPPEILRALHSANAQGWAETIILGRGGGSLEDLMAFNDEAVARAVFASDIPVISAVGHETDFSICDFVADLRAPTPSAAAELATADQVQLKEAIARSQRQLSRRFRDFLQRNMQQLDHLAHRLKQRHPAARLSEQAGQLEKYAMTLQRSINRRLEERLRVMDNLSRRLKVLHPGIRIPELARRVNISRVSLERLIHSLLHTRGQNIADLARTLNAVSPLETIGRGYAVVTSTDTGDVISSIRHTAAGEAVTAQLRDGRLYCRVEESTTDQLDPTEPSTKTPIKN